MLVTLMAPEHSPFLENKLLQNLKRLNAQAIQLHRFPKKDGIFPWVFPGSLLFLFGFCPLSYHLDVSEGSGWIND